MILLVYRETGKQLYGSFPKWYTGVAPAYLNAWQFLVAVTESAEVEVIVDKSWSGDGYAHSKMPSTSVLLVANG